MFSNKKLLLLTCLLLFASLFCLFGISAPSFAANPSTHPRLKVINGCDQPISIAHIVGAEGGTLNAPALVNLNPSGTAGDSVVYNIPDKGLAGTRFWPIMTDGKASIGKSGGPGLSCPDGIGCAPPVDSKFEGTFGCFDSISQQDCQINPSSPTGAPLPASDGWDTSMVDGYTLPYSVKVQGSCPGGPQKNAIDCSALKLSQCPTQEDLSSNGQYPKLVDENLVRDFPTSSGGSTGIQVGCYSPCSKLSMGNWQNIPNPPFSNGPQTYAPSDPQANLYCCATTSPEECRKGPVVGTQYVDLIHQYCPQTYAYAYDDVNGNFSCPATADTVYEVTFYCPQ